MIHFSYVHSIITHRIIFWGNSSNSNTIFKLQKRAIRIIMNAGNMASCRELFKKLNNLPLHSQYIPSLVLFIVKNIEEFSSNSEIHSINTRNKSNLFPPLPRMAKFQKGVGYISIKIFNNLPQHIKSLSQDINKFKKALKKCLLKGHFYTIDEYYDWSSQSDLGAL